MAEAKVFKTIHSQMQNIAITQTFMLQPFFQAYKCNLLIQCLILTQD